MPHREAEAVLADWYAIQHDLDAALFGTAVARRLHAEADRLRDEYEELVDDARRLGLPPLPPIPTPVEA
jgi:hypothetical protein